MRLTVVSVPSGDGDEGDGNRVVSDLLDEALGLLDNLVESVLGPLAGVHLVASINELPDTEGEGEEGVLSGLSVLGDTGLELSDTGGNDKDGAVSLRGTGDHVLDEVSVARGVDDGDLELGGLELPEGNVDGDTSLSLGLQFVEDPSVLERGCELVLEVRGRAPSSWAREGEERRVGKWHFCHRHTPPHLPTRLGLDSTDKGNINSHLPSSAASFSNFSMVRLSIPPHL